MDYVNLAESCGDLVGGAEIAQGRSANLRLTVETILSFGEGTMWGIRIDKPRWSEAGRALRPEPVLLLVGKKGESPAELLRSVADAWDHGDVELVDAQEDHRR